MVFESQKDNSYIVVLSVGVADDVVEVTAVPVVPLATVVVGAACPTPVRNKTII